MANRDGGITCALALIFHAVAVVLVLVTGTTAIGIFYSETLLVLAGSGAGLLGALVFSKRSRSDRLAICLGLVLALAAISWVIWIRQRFGLDETVNWLNLGQRFYQSIPKPVLELHQVPLRIMGPFLLIASILVAVRAIAKRAGPLIVEQRISRRTILTGIAVLLYAGFLLQARLIRTVGSELALGNEHSIVILSPGIMIPVLAVLAATFFLPGSHRIAWLFLFCIGGIGYLTEFHSRTSHYISCNITALLFVGFVPVSMLFRCGSIRNLEAAQRQKWKPVRAVLLAGPALALVFAGVMLVRTIDVGYWIMFQNHTLARAIVTLRNSGVAATYVNYGHLNLVLGDNVSNDVFARLLRDYPDLDILSIGIQGIRKDIDIGPLASASWAISNAGWQQFNQSCQLHSGEITESQLVKLMGRFDVVLQRDLVVRDSDPGPDALSGAMSLHLIGTADSVINQLNCLQPNTSIQQLSLTVQGDIGWRGESERAMELLEMVFEQAWGKRLVVQLDCIAKTGNWKFPEGECPWQSVDLTFFESNWRMACAMLPARKIWPVTVSFLQAPGAKAYGEGKALQLRIALASDGDLTDGLPFGWIRESMPGDFESCFEESDCVLRRDEAGNPVSLLALVPQWLETPSPEAARRVESLLVGAEWAGISVIDSNDLPVVKSEVLSRYSGLTRLGLGLNAIDDYSFLKQMPELRELQIAGETAPERQASLVQHLAFVPQLERFIVFDIPDGGTIRQLGEMANLKELIVVGIDSENVEAAEKMDVLQQRLPGVVVRFLPDLNFSAVRPDDLVEHQKQLLQQLVNWGNESPADNPTVNSEGK